MPSTRMVVPSLRFSETRARSPTVGGSFMFSSTPPIDRSPEVAVNTSQPQTTRVSPEKTIRVVERRAP
ncbi:MAG: hypothetical protein ACI8S6_005716 [Myxococcota bacterium]|jgi:hypothetical protein